MVKFVIFLVLCSLVAIVKGQSESPAQDTDTTNTTILSPEDEALQFNAIALDIIAKRLALANLPPELAEEGQQILSDASEGLAQCEESLITNHSIWQYKVCATAQLRNAIAAIRALQLASLKPPALSAA